VGDRIRPQRIRVRPDAQRRTAGQPDTGAIAGAGVAVDAEALLHHPRAILDPLPHQRPLSALAVQHAFGAGNDDLGPLFGAGQRLFQRVTHPCQVVGTVDGANPLYPDSPDRLLNRVAGRADRVGSPGREDVLPASGGGIAVVDDDGDAVVLVEYGVADARGQTVVPEAAVAHHADR